MESHDLVTVHVDFNDGTFVRYVIDEDQLESGREKAHEAVNSLKSGIRHVPDYTKASKQKMDNFVLDCVLLCLASEKRGKGVFAGTAIKDFHFLEGVDLPQFGTA